jgi:hypothetical protein
MFIELEQCYDSKKELVNVKNICAMTDVADHVEYGDCLRILFNGGNKTMYYAHTQDILDYCQKLGLNVQA